MKTVRKTAASVTGVSGFFSGKVSSSVAEPISDVEAQEEGYSDAPSVRIVMNDYDYAAEEPSTSSG